MIVRCGGCFENYEDEYDLCPFCGYYPGAPAREPYFLTPGFVLGERYVIGKDLGFGGFGVTYKAWDRKLDSVVAIKEYYPSGIVNRTPGTGELILFPGQKKKEFEFGLVRFIEEARNMTKFNTHKNIVNVYEYLEENNTAYIVMEYLDGCTLEEYMKQHDGRVPMDYGLQIIEATARALQDVHESGIIHRDVSPDNIFLCNDGTVKLIDFGAARFSAVEEKERTIILKPGFAPPEQYEQVSEQGPKTDIYALGATLYYVLTGVKPDESTNRKIKDILIEPNKLNPEIPQYINDSIMKAMYVEPHLRFESVEDFRKAIHQEIKVIHPKKERRRKKTKRFIGIASLMVVLIGIASVFAANIIKKQEQIALEDAEISIWYVAEPGGSVDTAYKGVIKEFNKQYENVKIQPKAIESAKYKETLVKALGTEKAPNLFISNGLETKQLSACLDLSPVITSEDTEKWFYVLINFLATGPAKNCYFLDKYDTLFPAHKQMPTSFEFPVLYVNKKIPSMSGFTADKIKGIEDIREYLSGKNKLIVSSEYDNVFTKLFGTAIDGNIQKGNGDQYFKGTAEMYFSSISDYYAARGMVTQQTGDSLTVWIDNDELPASWGDLWSVYPSANPKNKKAENEAAIRFLQFLLSDNAQSILYFQGTVYHTLPLSKNSVKLVSQAFDALAFLPFAVKNCVIQ